MIGELEQSREGLLQFSSEDPLLPVVKQELALKPGKKEEIARLFQEELADHKDKVIAVRSEDLLAFLNYLLQGKILVAHPKEALMSKTPGWYYLTPLYSSPFYNQQPELRGDYPQTTFYQDIDQNMGVYAPGAAFRAAFARNIIPVLKPDWKEKMRQAVAEIDEAALDVEGYPEALVFENFTSNLMDTLERISRSQFTLPQLLAREKPVRYLLLHDFVNLLRDDVDSLQVVEFLSQVVEERGGIVVGFNKSILEQGQVLTDATAPDIAVIHGYPEMAIKPRLGYIDLAGNPIVAIDVLGDYEDKILAELALFPPEAAVKI